MKLSDLKTNAAAANAGRWQKDIPGLGNIEVFVRSANNPDYRRRTQALIRALPPNKRPKGIVDPVEMDRINGICLLDHSLSDWRNMEGDDGQAIPYSKEQAKIYLTDPQWSVFREGVHLAALTVEDENAEADEEIEKNSEKPSATA